MENQEPGARSSSTPVAHNSYCALLLQAAGVLRLRYVHYGQDTTLSPIAAIDLANAFEALAQGDPEFDQIDPNEAIALAHRLIDNDHPELSRMWPRTS